MVQRYKPIKSDKPGKKYYIITRDDKRIYFGDSKYEHFTNGCHIFQRETQGCQLGKLRI